MNALVNPVFKRLEKFAPSQETIQRIDALASRYSKVGNSIFFTNDQFPWSYELEANWQVIRKELDRVMEHADLLPNFDEISPRQSKIAGDNLWKTYFFYAFGFKAKKNCDRCPETAKLLKKIPGLKVAFFSILAPGKHIPEHYGKHKGIIRYHLALKVPEPREKCRIRVADQIRYWEEGKSLIFDDTFPHEVWNETNGYRVVLFLDIARPLRFPLSLVNWLVSNLIAISPIVQVARTNHENWEKQFEDYLK
jgi:beta-hydroxylase